MNLFDKTNSNSNILLTPIEWVDGYCFKRDDKFIYHNVNGGKVRSALKLCKDVKTGLTTAGSKKSPQIQIISEIAKYNHLSFIAFTPGGELTPELLYAQNNGAKIEQLKMGFNNNLIKKAQQKALELNYKYIPFGMDCAEVLDDIADQVQNIPLEVKRIVVVVGSGITLSGILMGLEKYKINKEVVGICIGANPEKRLNRYVPFWKSKCRLIQSEREYDYEVRENKFCGIELDGIYEAKCIPYIQKGDLFWIIGKGIRSLSKCSEPENRKPKDKKIIIRHDSIKKVVIDGQEFSQKDLILPVSAFQGNKKCYLGFDATIFKNRHKNYDDVGKKEKEILSFLFGRYKKVEKINKEELYIRDLDLYIDLRLDYKHNFNAFNSKNKFHQNCLNELIEKNEVDMIRQWCVVDPKKRSSMVGKRYLEIFHYNNTEDLENQISRVFVLKRGYKDSELKEELNFILKNNGNYGASPVFNKIVTHFNPHIFKNENEFYANPISRRQHIENCRFLQYKEEHELSTEDILINFRFNKYVTFYSYFAIPWAKKFLNDYKPQRILDIFGGWGHRYLAFLNVPYIYNDLWKETHDGVKKIHEFCKQNISLPYKKFYNKDAGKFEFNKAEQYDTIFSCPPYFNFEIYDKNSFHDYVEFLTLWENSVKNSIHKDLRIFSFIIKSNYGLDLVNICKKYGLELHKEIPLGARINHHYNRLKNVKTLEVLYVMGFKGKKIYGADLFDS